MDPDSELRPNASSRADEPSTFSPLLPDSEHSPDELHPEAATAVEKARVRAESSGWVGVRLREWRARRGLTQSALARISGIDQSSVSNYESGKRNIPLTVLLRLMATLNVSLGDLVDLSDAQRGTDEVIVARDSLLGEAVARLLDGNIDVARARVEVELTWLISRRARSAVAEASRLGADIVVAALEAVSEAVAIAEQHHLDRCEIAGGAARSAIAEAALISSVAARRVEDAFEFRREEQRQP